MNNKGGKAATYVTDTLLKITASTKLEEDKKYGIKGFEAKVEVCKSRHAPAGRSFNMIYDQVNGFRNDLSILDYINSNGMLKGNGMAYYLDGLEDKDHKFKMSNFTQKLRDDSVLRDHFYALGEKLFRNSIKLSSNIETPIQEKDIPEVAPEEAVNGVE